MAIHQHKPTEVEAISFGGFNDNRPVFSDAGEELKESDWPKWVRDAFKNGETKDGAGSEGSMWVQTVAGGLALFVGSSEGVKAVRPSYVLIRGPGGDIYPCKAPIFEASYSVL